METPQRSIVVNKTPIHEEGEGKISNKDIKYMGHCEENVLSCLYLEVLLEFDWQHLCHDRDVCSPPVITIPGPRASFTALLAIRPSLTPGCHRYSPDDRSRAGHCRPSFK